MGDIMKHKLLVFNSYIQAFALLISGGLIAVLSFCNMYDFVYKAIKISQDSEMEYLRHYLFGWQYDEGTAMWYFIAFGVVLIISLITALLYKKTYSKCVYRLLSCAFIPLGIADFSYLLIGALNYRFSANVDALLSVMCFLVGFAYFIITFISFVKDIYKLRKENPKIK